METKYKEIRDRLREDGYKLTTQRLAVLDVISENHDKHLSSEEIYDLLKSKNQDIGIATVYRTLQLFERLDIIQRVNFDDGYNRYEIIMDKDDYQHHHLICIDCGSIVEVQSDLLENLEAEIENKNGFKILDHNVKFFGYCKDCQK